MPDVKIYIRPEAADLFEEAESYDKSLSRAIESAVRMYVLFKRAEPVLHEEKKPTRWDKFRKQKNELRTEKDLT